MADYMACEQCNAPFDPIACRWRCPKCTWKHHCCEGSALPAVVHDQHKHINVLYESA